MLLGKDFILFNIQGKTLCIPTGINYSPQIKISYELFRDLQNIDYDKNNFQKMERIERELLIEKKSLNSI